jgi:NDP-sugar pyrophosphorylase family protein
MLAMILAAGHGTRLKPITDHLPKALVKIHSKTLLEIQIENLIRHGFDHLIINTHHLADQIRDFIAFKKYPARIELSYESRLLDTGGGIKKMAREMTGDEPILVHNVDVISSLDLRDFYQHHKMTGADVTLAVQKRRTTRPLVFDERGQLCGRGSADGSRLIDSVCVPHGKISFFGFNGIQIIHPGDFVEFPPDRFSSIDLYLHLSQLKKKVLCCPMDDCYWRDLGRIQDLQAIEEDIHKGTVSLD